MGFIKNLIGGIISFITGLFGKKDGGYYLELKEEAGATSVTPTAVTPTAVTPTPVVKTTAPSPAVKAAAKTATPVAPKMPVATETSFATKYLIIPNNSERRRPGANMDTFIDMARQVKLPTA